MDTTWFVLFLLVISCTTIAVYWYALAEKYRSEGLGFGGDVFVSCVNTLFMLNILFMLVAVGVISNNVPEWWCWIQSQLVYFFGMGLYIGACSLSVSLYFIEIICPNIDEKTQRKAERSIEKISVSMLIVFSICFYFSSVNSGRDMSVVCFVTEPKLALILLVQLPILLSAIVCFFVTSRTLYKTINKGDALSLSSNALPKNVIVSYENGKKHQRYVYNVDVRVDDNGEFKDNASANIMPKSGTVRPYIHRDCFLSHVALRLGALLMCVFTFGIVYSCYALAYHDNYNNRKNKEAQPGTFEYGLVVISIIVFISFGFDQNLYRIKAKNTSSLKAFND